MDHQFVLLEGGGGRDGFKISEPLTFYSFLPRPEEKYSISRYLLDLLLLPLLTTTTAIFVSQTLTYLLKGKKGRAARIGLGRENGDGKRQQRYLRLSPFFLG